AAQILIIHGWTLVFIFLGLAQSGYEVTENLTWISTCKTLIGAALNIVLNLLLIPRYSTVGSALATLVAQIVSSLLLNALHPRMRQIFLMQLRVILLVPALRHLRASPTDNSGVWQP